MARQAQPGAEQALRQEHSALQLQQRETEQQLVLASRRQADEMVPITTSQAGAADPSANREELRADVQRELVLLRILADAQRRNEAQIEAQLSQVRISDIQISLDSRGNVGLFTDDDKHGIEIRNVTIEKNSSAIVGKAKVDLTNFWN